MKLQKIREKHKKLSESGYTLMKGLVAMIMVAALMSAIGSVIALSVGIRIQARRVELATRAAKSYIDGLNSGVISPPAFFLDDDEADNNTYTGGGPNETYKNFA